MKIESVPKDIEPIKSRSEECKTLSLLVDPVDALNESFQRLLIKRGPDRKGGSNRDRSSADPYSNVNRNLQSGGSLINHKQVFDTVSVYKTVKNNIPNSYKERHNVFQSTLHNDIIWNDDIIWDDIFQILNDTDNSETRPPPATSPSFQKILSSLDNPFIPTPVTQFECNQTKHSEETMNIPIIIQEPTVSSTTGKSPQTPNCVQSLSCNRSPCSTTTSVCERSPETLTTYLSEDSQDTVSVNTVESEQGKVESGLEKIKKQLISEMDEKMYKCVYIKIHKEISRLMDFCNEERRSDQFSLILKDILENSPEFLSEKLYAFIERLKDNKLKARLVVPTERVRKFLKAESSLLSTVAKHNRPTLTRYVAESMIDLRMDLNQNHEMESLLLHLIEQGGDCCFDVIDQLLSIKTVQGKTVVDVNAQVQGCSLLHKAVQRHDNTSMESSCLKTVKLLIDKGADILKQDADGNTPLHVFYAYSTDTEVSILLRTEADTRGILEQIMAIRNNRGQTPLEVSHLIV